jgi:hypothetical protein
MKKLIQLLETNVKVGSLGLKNTTTDGNTSNDLISSTLLKDIDSAAVSAGVKVVITTAVSGHRETTSSGNLSRHPNGTAVDIAIINDVSYKSDPTKFTQLGNSLVAKLKSMGYDNSGSESGHKKSVLWQVAEHYNHIHVSNTTDVASGGGTSSTTSTSTSSSINSDSRNIAKNFLVNMIGNAFGVNESKQERILKDIEKIKNLL